MTSADTGIIDQNSNETFQSDQVKEIFFPLGTKENPLGKKQIFLFHRKDIVPK